MIKRSTAYFYILLTSFVLLAHAVIPHHHHKSEIFIVNSDFQTEKGAHKHGTEHNHEGHNKNNVDNCVLKQDIIIPTNHSIQEFKCLNCKNNYSQFDGFKTDLFKKGISVLFLTVLSNKQVTLLSSTYSAFASTGLGLRAPPTVV